MRYHEFCEDAASAQRNAEKRRAANARLDAARKRKADAGHRYQDTLRSSNDAMQRASSTLSNIEPS